MVERMTKYAKKEGKGIRILRGAVSAGLGLGLAASLVSVVGFRAASKTSLPPLVISPGPGEPFSLNFNPFDMPANLQGTNEIYQPLFLFNMVSPAVDPMLGLNYRWSNHNTVLTVNLRHGVTWSNGNPFTSKDVVFTFNTLKRYPQLDYNAVWKVLTSVSAPGPYQVTFHFKSPQPLLDYI